MIYWVPPKVSSELCWASDPLFWSPWASECPAGRVQKLLLVKLEIVSENEVALDASVNHFEDRGGQ